MFFITEIIIASLATLGVAGLDNSPPSDEVLLAREPHAISHFQIYDPPVDVSRSVGEQTGDNTGIEHKIRTALAYLENKHGIEAQNVRVTDAFTNKDTGVSHVYVRQTADGLDLVNGLANMNIDKHGKVISSSQTFVPTHQLRKTMRSSRRGLTARTDQYVSLKTALKTLSERVKAGIDDNVLNSLQITQVAPDKTDGPKFTIEGIPTKTAIDGMATAQQAMMRRSDGSLVLVWDITLKQKDHRWNARVNTETGCIEFLVDRMSSFGNHARRHGVVKEGVDNLKPAESSTAGALLKRLSYKVIPITRQDPRDGFEFIVDPESGSSPNGWVYTSTTSGNNVIAFKGSQTDGVAHKTSPGTFDYDQDETASPATPQNVGAAITNVFYVVNSLHDILYLYGFTEATFNFQDDNFGRGGQGNDRVTASVQDNTDLNTGDFYTPPDGQNGELRVSLYDLTNPDRDGGLDVSLVSNLYTRGVANRLTGGGSAACLQSRPSLGLVEGWADAMADWLQQTDTVPDFTLGSYLENNVIGFRRYPYSRDSTVNPLTYSDAPPSEQEVHIGEVWANMLHNVLADLADAHGWSSTALTDPTGDLGNVVFLHLLMDGLSIQPCEPTFITARDAIIQADQNRYNGDHYCILWRVFASRGLGFGAAEDNINEYSVPPQC